VINLYIVDDDTRLATQIQQELGEHSEIGWIKTSDSGLAFVESLKGLRVDQHPACVLMDVSMSVPDEGIRATRLLHEQYPQIKIIMFTISDEDDLVFDAFKAGAMGYLLKNEKPAFILKAIVEVMQGGALMSPSIAVKTIRFLSSGKIEKPGYLQSYAALTERELEILRLIAKGYKYKEVADQLFISLHTVKKHISNIFEKLQVNNRIEALNKSKGLF
jgi:DNA-binding NarL/FixJ family response regulator